MLEIEDVTKDIDASWVRNMYENPKEEDIAVGRQALLSGSVGGEMPLQIAKARGASFWDQVGREYIDCTSQAWSLNVGACHPKIMACAYQLRDHAPSDAFQASGGNRPR
jgi:4-aminobutyrate aminotransferase-like enzyme